MALPGPVLAIASSGERIVVACYDEKASGGASLTCYKSEGEGERLVVEFVAVREATVPSSLGPRSVEAEPDALWSGYLIRLVAGLVIFAIIVGVLLSIGIPFINGIMRAGSPDTFLLRRLA